MVWPKSVCGCPGEDYQSRADALVLVLLLVLLATSEQRETALLIREESPQHLR